MKKNLKLLLFLPFFIVVSCDKNKEIRRLLNSNTPTSRIEGAWKAGEPGDKQYIPLLLHDAGDPSVSTSLRWKGYSVYTETMFALERICHIKPPHFYKDILVLPDSVNIKFYATLWQNMNKKK